GDRTLFRRGLHGASLGGAVAMRSNGVLFQVDEIGEPLVSDGTVVTLKVILHNDFPVGSHVVSAALAELEIQRRGRCQQSRGKLTDNLVPTRCLWIGLDKKELPQHTNCQWSQRKILVSETQLFFGAWRGAKVAVQAPGPAVVVALERV